MQTFYQEPLDNRVADLEDEASDASDRLDVIESALGKNYKVIDSQASFPASSTPTSLASVELPAGVYVISGYVSIAGAANASGTSRICEARIYIGNTAECFQRQYSTNAGAVSPINLTYVLETTVPKTVSLRAFSTLAVSSSSPYWLRIVQIA